jgi:hypothetical protein
MLLLAFFAPWAANAQTSLWSEDFEDGSMTGWTTDGSGTWSVATGDYSSSTGAGHGTYNAKITHGTSGNVTKLITPEIDLSSVASAELSFMHVQRSWSGDIDELKVYYRTSSSGSWTLLDGQAYSNAVASWTTEEGITLPNLSSTYQIAFEYTDHFGYGVGVDYVNIVQGASCVKPNGLAATLTPGNGSIATLNWTESGTATNWVLEYGTADDFTGATSVNVSGTPSKDLTGLVAETTYYARVKADCGGGDMSDWSATCEFTPTNALTLTVNDGTTTNSYVPIYGYYADATQQSEFIIPAANLASINGATLNSMTFYANYNFTSTSTFQVYLKEVEEETFSGTTFYTANEATTVYTGTVTVSSTDGMTITFNSGYDYVGKNLLVGFYTSGGGNYSNSSSDAFYGVSATGASISMYSSYSASQKNFLPKVTFAYSINPFKAPRNLTVSNITNEGATVAWEAPVSGTPTGYKYQYMPEGGSWTTLTTTTALSAPLTGLTANTNYTFQVQAIYSDGESVFASTTFTTECDAFAIPYEYGFETEADMACWETLDCEVDATYGLSGYLYNATSNQYARGEAGGCFGFSSYGGNTEPQYLFSPELTGIANGLHVEFYYRSLQADDPETFMVGYSTTDKNPASFTWGTEVTSPGPEYQLFKANYLGQVKYVAVKYTSANSYFLFLDDFTFEEVAACLEPTDVLASDITTTGATISWTPGTVDDDQWSLYYTTDATEVPDETTVPSVTPITATSYELTTLTPATTYYVYVRTDCHGSDWSVPVTFNTLCEGMDLPFTYGFEDDELSVCWNKINDNPAYNSAQISTSNAHEGSKSLSFYRGSTTGDLVVVLPVVSSTYDLSDYQIEYYAKASNTYVNMAIGIMTDPDDVATFVAQDEAFNPATSYTKYRVRFNGYTGAGNYVAIKVSRASGSSGYIYLDDLYVSAIPACLETTDPVVSEITAHTAKLDWTGTSAGYNLEYRSAAYMNGFSEAFNTSGVPSGWTQYTGLVDEVIAGTATLSSGSGWGTSTYGLGTYNLRLNIYGNSRKHWVVTPEFTLADGSAMSFDLALTAYNGNGAASGTCDDDRFAVLVFADNAWTILREWNNSGSHYVYTDIATTGETVSDIDISAYVGKTVKFAFYGESTVTGNGDNDLHIDNVTIGTPVAAGEWQTATTTEPTATLTGLTAETPYEVRVQGNCGAQGVGEWSNFVTFTTTIACPAPTGLAYANLKSTQVDLSWTNGGADNWIVAYKQTADTDFTEVSVSSADVTLEGNTVTYTLTGLTEETAYTVKVSDNCEVSYPGDGTSAWTSTVSFTTMAACSVDNVTIDNIGHYTATVTWNGESASGFTVSYREAASINGISEDFGTDPTDWIKRTGVLNADGTATLSGTSSWSTGTSNGVFDRHAYMNLYSTKNYWYITPSMTIKDGDALNFDLAHTAYSGTQAAPNTGCTTHRFAVLISTDNMATWTILREWNNSGSAYVLDEVSPNGQNSGNIDLSAYAGGTAYIAFFGHSETSSYDNNMHFDNVTIGTPVAAGDWQTLSATESPANLTGLTVGTMYDVKVAPNCDETLASDIVTFSTVSGDVKYFLAQGWAGGNWDDAANWEPEGVPTLNQTVELRADVNIYTEAEAKSIAQGEHAITIDVTAGGKLKHDNSGVTATVKKNITAYPDATERSGYYLIANPLYTTISTTSTPAIASTGLLTGDYDLYNWSYSSNLEWANYKYSPFSLSTGMYGYLYANAADVELTFTGTLRASNSSVSRSANYSTSYEFGKWTLLGNPFVCDAYLVSASTGGTALAYYRMNAAGDGFEAVTGGAIAPMEGVFYEASTSGSVYMVRTAPVAMSNGNGNLNIVLAQNVTARGAKGSTDNAIIRFGEGNTLSKFSFNENNAKVYIPQDGKDYAVVNAGNVGEMPVNFKTNENGTYTLSFNSENVTFSYLHLIDNMTGADVDLLETPSYSFDARYTDYASRFRLVFATGSSIDGDSFGYVNGNGNLSIFGIEGEATVQVIDMLGHILSSETFSGSYEKQLNAAPGVYMIRLINGNDVKVQKIVIK